MQRKIIMFFSAIMMLVLMALPVSANSCIPVLDMGFIKFLSDKPNTIEYSVELDESDCGAPNVIGVIIAVEYIWRTDVSDPWSPIDTIAWYNILPDELSLYSAPGGTYVISNMQNIANKIDDEFSKFRLHVIIFDHETQTDTRHYLGWMDGPNDWQVSARFDDRPGDLTDQQKDQDNDIQQVTAKR